MLGMQHRDNPNKAFRLQITIPAASDSPWLSNHGLRVASFISQNYLISTWQTHWQYGLILRERPNYVNNSMVAALFYHSALVVPFFKAISIVIQLDGNTPLPRGELAMASGFSHQLSLGLRQRIGTWNIHAIITEDIQVDSAPDVGLQLGISRQITRH